MANVDELRRAQRADGPATIMAIGTANPPNCFDHSDYADFLFRVTNSEQKTELKEKFKRMCDRTMIKKRYFHLTEEVLKKNPNICEYKAPSFDSRQGIGNVEVPKLGKEAAEKAIKEWGQPVSSITHLVFCTTTCVELPGADYQLIKLLGLSPSVKRSMMYQQGCHGGAATLRYAKDLAENNKGARVLVVCSEITVLSFQAPNEDDLDVLIGMALFGDGAAALIVGSDPIVEVEKPLFEIVFATPTLLSDTRDVIFGDICEAGLIAHIKKDAPMLISSAIEKILLEAFQPLGITDWNSIFWVAHAGGRAILDQLESKLNLKAEKLKATRNVMSEYGNLASSCVMFVLDEVRKTSTTQGMGTTGEGLEWGVLVGFGPGLSIETIVLRSVSI